MEHDGTVVIILYSILVSVGYFLCCYDYNFKCIFVARIHHHQHKHFNVA